MSFYLHYTEEFNRANLTLVSKLSSLSIEEMNEAWRIAFAQKMLNPIEFVAFLDWMPDYLIETNLDEHISDIIYEEMHKASTYLEEAWKNIESNGIDTRQFFAPREAEEMEDFIQVDLTSPFTREDFGWHEVTKLGEAIGLLQNGSYTLGVLKKSSFTGLIECLIKADLVKKHLPIYRLQEIFGQHYRIRINTDRITHTRSEYFDKASKKLPKLFPYINKMAR